MKIDTSTKVVGIVGYPVKHSLSPILHNTLFSELHLNYVYLSFEIHPTMFNFLPKSIRIMNIAGLNVTIPYKEKILRYLDSIDPLAKEIGAVNTIVNKNGKLIGYNTDVYGFIESLSQKNLKNKDVFVLGCGGVSKAIIVGLKKLNVNRIFVSDIDRKKVENVKKLHKKLVEEVKPQKYSKILSKVEMFINATPVGMKENDPAPIPLEYLSNRILIYDVIYNRETELIKYAKKIGSEYIDGKPMFIYQAAESFFLWTGIKPPIETMFKIINQNL